MLWEIHGKLRDIDRILSPKDCSGDCTVTVFRPEPNTGFGDRGAESPAQEKSEQRQVVKNVNHEKVEQQRLIGIVKQQKSQQLQTVKIPTNEMCAKQQACEEQHQLIERLTQEKRELSLIAESLSHQRSEQQQVIENLNQEKSQQQRLIRILQQEKSEQQQIVESLTNEMHAKQQECDGLSRKGAEHQQVIQGLAKKESEQQQLIEHLSQEKVMLQRTVDCLRQQNENLEKDFIRHRNVAQERVHLSEKTIHKMPLEEWLQLHKENARLEERCAQKDNTIQSREHDIKKLKDEIDDMRCLLCNQSIVLSSHREDTHTSNNLLQRRAENYDANSSSSGDSTWIQVSFNDVTARSNRDDASCVSIGTSGARCWMSDAVFTIVENGKESYVKGHSLAEGSLVRAADGKTIMVADPPKRHETDAVLVLHAGGAKLPLTHTHRVPTVTATGEEAEKYAKDLQEGDLVYVDGKPVELMMKEEMVLQEKREVLQIRFVPDHPVAVFMAPPTIETKGHKKKKVRRGLRNRRQWSELRTEGYYTD